MKKVLLTTVLSLMMCMGVYAQDYDWKKPPKSTEKEIGIITDNYYGGRVKYYTRGKNKGEIFEDRRVYVSDEKLYENLLYVARNRYGKEYPKLMLRNFKYTITDKNDPSYYSETVSYAIKYHSSATVVIPDAEIETNENLSKVFDKALRKVSEGSRLAIDQVSVIDNMDSETLKDQILDVLLDKGYRVVAKEYLQKLDKEIKDAKGSGYFNPDTMVDEGNFSAVGYFINVKVTESSMRVQVVDVSKGEYVGNATVNF